MRPTAFQPVHIPDELLMKQSKNDIIIKNKPKYAHAWTPPVKHTAGLRRYFMPLEKEDREEDSRKRPPQTAKQYNNIREARAAIIKETDELLNENNQDHDATHIDPSSYQGADQRDATTKQQEPTFNVDDVKLRINPIAGVDPPFHAAFVYYDKLKKAKDENHANEEQINELTRIYKMFQHVMTHGELPRTTRIPMSMTNHQFNWFERNGAFIHEETGDVDIPSSTPPAAQYSSETADILSMQAAAEENRATNTTKLFSSLKLTTEHPRQLD